MLLLYTVKLIYWSNLSMLSYHLINGCKPCSLSYLPKQEWLFVFHLDIYESAESTMHYYQVAISRLVGLIIYRPRTI